MKITVKRSPMGTAYMKAELRSVKKGQYGQWIVTMLLDETQYETMQYYGWSKGEARAIAEREYGLCG